MRIFTARYGFGFAGGCSGRSVFFAVVLAVFAGRAVAVDVPANMIITGTIGPSESGVAPAVNDQVVISRVSDGKNQGLGTVRRAADGSFSVDMSKSSDFNGTILTAKLKHQGATYQLNDGDSPVSFPFSGGLFPNKISLSLTIGAKIASEQPDGGSSDGGDGDDGDKEEPGSGDFDPRFDVNGDGALTHADVDLVKDVVSGAERAMDEADVNQDGVINSRDIIDTIKAWNGHRRRGLIVR